MVHEAVTLKRWCAGLLITGIEGREGRQQARIVTSLLDALALHEGSSELPHAVLLHALVPSRESGCT